MEEREGATGVGGTGNRMMQEPEQEDLSGTVEKESVVTEEAIFPAREGVAVVERAQENEGVSGSDAAKVVGKEVVAVEDMDEEVLQEQAQAVVEELQKRGACTTLALARMLGLEKSTELNPLLYLLLEKNVVVRVTDIPPIWALSPTFPISPLPSSAPAVPAVRAAPKPSFPAPAANVVLSVPAAAAYSPPPAYTGVQSLQPARVMAQPPHQPAQHVNRQPSTIITFPPIPAEGTAKPIITFPPIPAEPQVPSESNTLQPQQQLNADYWQSLHQMSGGKNIRNGGPAPSKKWKKQKNLSELQVRLLKELKERGALRTLELSKIVGLVTCRDVNPSIYDLKQRNLVTKVNNAPPIWQLNESGMNRAQFKLPGMEVDDAVDQSDREIVPGVSFGDGPLMTVNSQGHSSLSFFH